MPDLPLKDIRTWLSAPYAALGSILGLVDGNPRLIDPTPWAKGEIFAIRETSGSAYTLTLDDAGALVTHTNAAAATITIPTHTLVALPVKTRVRFVQGGAGRLTFTPASGVTLRVATSRNKTRAQWSTVELIKKGESEWMLTGDVNT